MWCPPRETMMATRDSPLGFCRGVLAAFCRSYDDAVQTVSGSILGVNPLMAGLFRPGTRRHATRHSHSAIVAITSPNSNSAADQTSAETKLAIWNCQYDI